MTKDEALELALDLAIMHHSDDGYAELRLKVRQLAKEALAQPPEQAWSWVCNECGAREFTSAVLEADLEYLACAGCGCSEFHKDALAQPEQEINKLIRERDDARFILRKLHEQIKDALAQPEQERKKTITLTHAQASELMMMFSDADADTEITLIDGSGHSGKGIYAYYTELPEEGAEILDAIELPAQPEQEPVGWQYREANDDGTWRAWSGCDKRLAEDYWRQVRAIYTTPLKRPWVGLTDEEIIKTFNAICNGKPFEIARILELHKTIEAKLKSKNA